MAEEEIVKTLLEDAQSILATARQADRGDDARQFTIILSPQGMRIVCGSDWPLDSLRRQHGMTSSAFRVYKNGSSVAVEGRSREGTCRIEAPGVKRVANWNGFAYPINVSPANLPATA